MRPTTWTRGTAVAKLCGLVGRLALIGAAMVTAVGVSAAPASARVEVRADEARPGATNVRVSFFAEAKSRVAGIAFLRVVLPRGIAPGDVRLLAAPPGWNLSPTPDGYNVGGPPLEVGQGARYQVNVARLPRTAQSLPFQTLQTYSDGRIEQDNRVPVLALAAPPPPTRAAQPPPRVEQPARPPRVEQPAPQTPEQQPVSPSSEPTFALPTESPAAVPPLTTEPEPSGSTAALTNTAGNSSRSALWITLGAVALLLAPVGLLVQWRRRTPRTKPEPLA